MAPFSEKLKKHREDLEMNQQQLADLVGVSKRMIAAYETNESMPRRKIMEKLASALKVSVDYLVSDAVTDPLFGIEKAPYIAEARRLYGKKGANEAELLLEQNMALFAGGNLDQEAKDQFFEAVMRAYLACKEEARRIYGHS